MPDPQPHPSSRPQRINDLIAESGLQLKLTTDSRIESLRCYQHWTIKDLDTLSGITEFSEIMCAVEWLQQALSLDLENLASSLYLEDLETLTVRELLLQLGVPTELLDVESSQRTVAEYVQTAYNAFHLQAEYQDDLTATGKLMEQLRDYASAKDITLIQPYDLLEAAVALRMVLLARSYPTVELALTLRSQTTVGGVPLDSLSETLNLRVKQTPESLRVTLWPDEGRSTVLEVHGKVTDQEPYIGGLDALQTQALEDALRERTQAILSTRPVSDETLTLRTLLHQVWPTYLLTFEEYTSRPATVQQSHLQDLQPLALIVRAALWQQFEDIYQQYANNPLTLAVECQKVIKAYLQEQVENAVYRYGRLAYLAQDTATVVAQALAEPEYSWTEAQNEAAKAEGWHVVDVGDDTAERDRYRLQAFDRSRFQTDEQVWLWVVQQSRRDSSNLHSQLLAFLQSQAQREHRLVWVYAYTHLVKEALQSPAPMRTWLQTLSPQEFLGWRPVEVFLQSLGVQRVSVSDEIVWLWYWDEEDPIPVLGMDSQGQPLPDAPIPQWLVDLDAELSEIALNDKAETPNAMSVFHYVNRVIPD